MSAALSTPTVESLVLRADRVSKSFPGNVTALDGIDLALSTGQLVALVGGNGSGKTTLLKLIAGQLRPDGGSLTVLGSDPALAESAMRRNLTSVSQTPALDPEMTVGETLRFFAILYELPSGSVSAVVADAARSFALQEILTRRVSACSGGMRQRLHLAAAMLHDSALMLLDEPTNNLDTEGREFLWNLLLEKAGTGVAVLLSTHDLAAVASFADRVLLMHQGRLLADARPQELMAEYGVPLLELRFTQSRCVTDELKQSLQTFDFVEEVVFRQGSVVISFSGDAGDEQHILHHLAEAGMVVSSTTRHVPDLASACWVLTKDWVDRPGMPSPGGGRGRGRGRQMGRKG